MRRPLAWLALLAACAAVAAPLSPRFWRFSSRSEQGRTHRGFDANALAFFEFAPSSGAGLPSAASLSSVLTASDLSGNWSAVYADGTTAGQPITATSIPAATTQTVCPDGPSCATETVTRLASGSRWVTTSTQAQASSGVTACALVQFDAVTSAAAKVVVGHTNGSGSFSFSCDVSTVGNFSCTAKNTSAATSQSGNAALTPGVRHFVCGTYSTSDGVPRVYLDGIAGSPGTALSPAALSAVSVAIGFGDASSGTFGWSGRGGWFGGFYTETQLSAARILAISNAVLARNPSGAKNEPLTFARASTAFCETVATDGGLWGGAGTMVPSNVPCITGGGLRVEAAQAGSGNVALQSQALNLTGGAPWLTGGTGAAAPTITADQAVAPDGTMTADRVQIPATNAGQISWVLQSVGTAAAYSGSVYLRGNGGAGLTDLCIQTGASTYSCSTCAFNASSWIRCTVEGVTSIAAGQFSLGNWTTYNGGITRGAVDVFAWGMQMEQGSKATSYMPTTGVAAARAIESMRTTGTYAVTGTNLGSMAITAQSHNVPNPQNLSIAIVGGNDYESLYSSGGANVVYDINLQTRTTGALVTPLPHRFAGYTDGTNIGACYDGSCTTAARTGSITNGARTIWLGVNSIGTSPTNGIIKQVCYDPDPSRCR